MASSADKEKYFSMDEVQRHCREDDLWLVKDGKVYDLTPYYKEHPGGSFFYNCWPIPFNVLKVALQCSNMRERSMAPVDTRDDRKVREAEVFCYSEHMEMASIGQLCNLAFKALQMQTSMMELARSLKVKLDEKFPGQWMVIIGKTFGAYLTVDARNFVHFRIGRTYFMLHKQH